MAQRAVGYVFLSAQPTPAGAGQATDPRRCQDGARSRLRHRHAFYATLQSLGSAAVPGAGWRPLPRDQGKAPRGADQRDRHFTKNGIRLKDGSDLQADIIVTATGL